jgi:quercetin dioxygenase-like cupin family protein
MPVRSSTSIPSDPVPAGTGTRRQVLIGPDVGPNFALRKFIMEPGGGMPLHTNTVEHEQYVLRGRARVVIGEEVSEVQRDDVVFIPGGVPHSYQALGDEPFEFLCMVPNLPDETKLVDGAPAEDGPETAGDGPGSAGGESAADDLVVPEDELGC